jgi:hypothetical protein
MTHEFITRATRLPTALGEFFAMGAGSKTGSGGRTKNRGAGAKKTSARGGKTGSPQARAERHVKKSSGAGRGNASAGETSKGRDRASDRRTTYRVGGARSAQSAGKDPDRGGKRPPE